MSLHDAIKNEKQISRKDIDALIETARVITNNGVVGVKDGYVVIYIPDSEKHLAVKINGKPVEYKTFMQSDEMFTVDEADGKVELDPEIVKTQMQIAAAKQKDAVDLVKKKAEVDQNERKIEKANDEAKHIIKQVSGSKQPNDLFELNEKAKELHRLLGEIGDTASTAEYTELINNLQYAHNAKSDFDNLDKQNKEIIKWNATLESLTSNPNPEIAPASWLDWAKGLFQTEKSRLENLQGLLTRVEERTTKLKTDLQLKWRTYSEKIAPINNDDKMKEILLTNQDKVKNDNITALDSSNESCVVAIKGAITKATTPIKKEGFGRSTPFSILI